jgi:tetratricopeptide (TPR) repeat protein
LEQGDGSGSTRVLREALAMDTGFASAWFAIGWNYLNDRLLDSARLAFAEALKRPERLGVPRRYRVEADAAYALHYDLEGAIRAYNLYLDHFPRSYGVLNSRGNYLVALGRYEEALKDFAEAVRIHPFGPQRAQMQLLNEAATLVTLGKTDQARDLGGDLRKPFSDYLQLMLVAATGQWASADSIGNAAAGSPSSPNWVRVQATTTVAAALAARGRIAAADKRLEEAGRGVPPEILRWYTRARLLLDAAAHKVPPTRPDAAARDTSPAGLVTYGLWAAAVGDTVSAQRNLRRVLQSSLDTRAVLGYGPALLQATIAARGGRWREVLDAIALPANLGEHDSALLDRVSSPSLRWLAAEAYAQSGNTDSAVAMMALVIRPTRLPGNAFALRGLVYPFAHQRLAIWHTLLGHADSARAHWRAVLETLQDPDSELMPLVQEARRGTASAVRSD